MSTASGELKKQRPSAAGQEPKTRRLSFINCSVNQIESAIQTEWADWRFNGDFWSTILTGDPAVEFRVLSNRTLEYWVRTYNRWQDMGRRSKSAPPNRADLVELEQPPGRNGAGSHYASGDTIVPPGKLVFYAHSDVEPLRTLHLLDEVGNVAIGLCYMGIYADISMITPEARRILTFDGEVCISSTTRDGVIAHILPSAERQIAETDAGTERLADAHRQVAARNTGTPKGSPVAPSIPAAAPTYGGYTQSEWDEWSRSHQRGTYSQAEWHAWNRSRRY
ncbi:kptA [Symbiodinium sp. CCMP2456]|nr:kptA [Symbiodinium sp. CCMP2456]